MYQSNFHDIILFLKLLVLPSVAVINIIVLAADAAAFYINDVETISAKDLSTFFIKIKPHFSDGPRSLHQDPHNCIILDN